MNIKIWKPGQKGNPSDRQYYCQFFQRKKRYRGVLEARNAEQAKLEAQGNGMRSGIRKTRPNLSQSQSQFGCLPSSLKMRICPGPIATRQATLTMCA
ncbi:MAG TPA: hypothetical protein VN843_02475 [Anaerolineales bacterium]|nr:hypothetical protein [Anaerolineales bacterium]